MLLVHATSLRRGPSDDYIRVSINDVVGHELCRACRLADGSADVIGSVMIAVSYAVDPDFRGHGIGSTLHPEPLVRVDGRDGCCCRVRPGLLLALEAAEGLTLARRVRAKVLL